VATEATVWVPYGGVLEETQIARRYAFGNAATGAAARSHWIPLSLINSENHVFEEVEIPEWLARKFALRWRKKIR
jgi:hypothetical protein